MEYQETKKVVELFPKIRIEKEYEKEIIEFKRTVEMYLKEKETKK